MTAIQKQLAAEKRTALRVKKESLFSLIKFKLACIIEDMRYNYNS